MPAIKSRQQERDEESRRMDLLMELSKQLEAELDAEALSAMWDLCKAGVPTEKIVAIIIELKRVAATEE